MDCRAAADVLTHFMLGLHHENISCCVSFAHQLICSQRTRLQRQTACTAYMHGLSSAGKILLILVVVQRALKLLFSYFSPKASISINNTCQSVQNENEWIRKAGKKGEKTSWLTFRKQLLLHGSQVLHRTWPAYKTNPTVRFPKDF